jgi:hypothetical protein
MVTGNQRNSGRSVIEIDSCAAIAEAAGASVGGRL